LTKWGKCDRLSLDESFYKFCNFVIFVKILWLTWKDKKHPQAGGAEVVNEELAKHLAGDGHEVLFLVGWGGCRRG
jgi:hypothetical protein